MNDKNLNDRFNKAIADRKRWDKDFTKKKLAEKIFCTPQYISSVCSGKKPLTLDLATLAAPHLNVSVEYLMGETDYKDSFDELEANWPKHRNEYKIIQVIQKMGHTILFCCTSLEDNHEEIVTLEDLQGDPKDIFELYEVSLEVGGCKHFFISHVIFDEVKIPFSYFMNTLSCILLQIEMLSNNLPSSYKHFIKSDDYLTERISKNMRLTNTFPEENATTIIHLKKRGLI